MDEILLLAERLGKAISESPQAAALRAARDAMQGQADLQQMLKDYQAQAEKIAKLTEDNKTVEVEDKHRLRELQDKLVGSEIFKTFTAAQVEYIDLMRKVNETLQTQLAETESES